MSESSTTVNAIIGALEEALSFDLQKKEPSYVAGSIFTLRNVVCRLTLTKGEAEVLYSRGWNSIIGYHTNVKIPKHAEIIQLLEFFREDLQTKAFEAQQKENDSNG